MTPFPALLDYSTSICGSCVSSRSPFLLPAGMTILVLVTARETISAWYSSFGSSPIGALLRCSGYYFGGCYSALFYVSVIMRCTSPLRMVLGVHVLSRMSFIFRVLASCSSDPMLALKSLTLSTWCQHFQVQRLLNPPSGVLIVSARETGVISPAY